VRRWVIRSIGVAAAALLVIGAAHVLYDAVLCPQHRRWVQVTLQHEPVIRDDGYLFARTGDAIYACVSPHRLDAILTWHQDLDCYCAPAQTGADAVGRLLGGQCVVDQLAPMRNDDRGACRHAHCSEHLDP
jgi:hypothetical protein